jgi:outer membrane lipoprotein-sorting protein
MQQDVPTAQAADPAKLLKWSMDKYAGMKSFSARCDWKSRVNDSEEGMSTQREIAYGRPNRFKVLAKKYDYYTVSISDGQKLVEYSNKGGFAPWKAAAPESIQAGMSMNLSNPMICGSPLYQFFGGSKNYANLVNAPKKKIAFGKEEKTPGGEMGKTVTFYGHEMYGNMDILIGLETGLVHRITYDNAGLFELMKQQSTGTPKDMRKMITTEQFSDIKVDPKLDAKLFVAKVPAMK